MMTTRRMRRGDGGGSEGGEGRKIGKVIDVLTRLENPSQCIQTFIKSSHCTI